MSKESIAFALGGLGGFNAHGIGFLQASLDQGIEPELISCTSGQIYWTWRYLLQKNHEPDPLTGASVNMEQELRLEVDKTNRFPKPLSWLDGPVMAMSGDPGIFSPAVKQYWQNWLSPYINSAADFDSFWKQWGEELMNRMFPAQVFVPERSPESMLAIGQRLASESEIGILFNAFDAPAGEEVLFINPRAQQVLDQQRPGRYVDGALLGDTRIRVLDPNNPEQLREAVDAALWLYLYGFKDRDGNERTLIDGAYHRQFIVRELAPAAQRIFSVRPQSVEWKEAMPTNSFQVSNLVTQLWFNASYSGEVAHIDLINRLLRKEHLPKEHYRHVELTPVEYETRIHFYEYFVERWSVYQDAYDNSRACFDDLDL
ncbi:hypothetical protein DV711_02290 [Motiliproteus coralliicola]|uniref:Patatin-like phospholipase family protein n=1 Tax=Motiliproteus coralliicola TaxID=2283196 RepID=A0A369WRZ6_9GAMM|nr:hypothetical protein [Motiliproteus coralliicola]RDE24437.1 hypothetical protein DV711_02290 [Motiliproteus coralliicola]